MLNTRDQIRKIIDYQKSKSKELNRQVTYFEAIALWLSESVIETSDKVKKMDNLNLHKVA